MPVNQHTLLVLSVLLLALVSTRLDALEFDKTQPIEIESRQVVHHRNQSKTVYEGDVTLQQGSLEVTADNLTLTNKGDQVTHIRATGLPARFWQRSTASDDDPVTGHAKAIEYDLDKRTLSFVGDATLIQKTGSIHSDRISYNLDSEVAVAEPLDAEKGRVRAILNLNTLKDGQ